MLTARGAQFVSLTDPPDRLRAEAEACRNEGTWPVLVGEPGSRDTLLSSPIILEDHPRIAPESPGDLFDGGEIDGLLTLNILSLTDEEKAEMRDSDPRTREILERTENLSEEEMMRLHGAIRDLRHRTRERLGRAEGAGAQDGDRRRRSPSAGAAGWSCARAPGATSWTAPWTASSA